MDPVTTAIVAAVSAGAAAGATKVCEQAIVDAYAQLKDLLKKKFGMKSEVAKAVKALEARPNSVARKEVVAEEMMAAKADQDSDLLRAAQALLEAIKTRPTGSSLIQTAIGDRNIQVAGNWNTISMDTELSSDPGPTPPKSKQ